MAGKRQVSSLVGTLIALIVAPSAQAFAPCHEREVASKSVRLLTEPDDYQFYYRIEPGRDQAGGPQYVIYISPEVAIRYIDQHSGFRSIPLGLEPSDWRDLLPLERHTDIFQPLLNVVGRPSRRMMSLVANSIESGNVAIWNVLDGYMDEVVVENYDEGCEGGRVYKDSRGTVFFAVIDRIA